MIPSHIQKIKQQKERKIKCLIFSQKPLIIPTHYICCLKLALLSLILYHSFPFSLYLSISLSLYLCSIENNSAPRAPIWKEFHAPQKHTISEKDRPTCPLTDRICVSPHLISLTSLHTQHSKKKKKNILSQWEKKNVFLYNKNKPHQVVIIEREISYMK